jgi:hypothetical protein
MTTLQQRPEAYTQLRKTSKTVAFMLLVGVRDARKCFQLAGIDDVGNMAVSGRISS